MAAIGITSRIAQRGRIRAMVWSCVALIFAAMTLWVTGATAPQLRWGVGGFGVSAFVDDHGVLSTHLFIEAENLTMVSVTLAGLSMDIPGVRLLPVNKDERAEITVGAGESETFERRLVITDCAAVPHEPRPVRFTYRTWLASGESEVTMDSWPERPERPERLEGSGQEDEDILVAWQRALANKVCDDALRSW